MSIWGHIAGVIRVDGMSTSLTEENFIVPHKAPVDIGTMTPDYNHDYTRDLTEEQEKEYFEERQRQWKAAEESGIPMGSEGSITWEWLAHKRGDIQYDGRYIITGDLRDYEDVEPVFQWLKKVKEKIEAVPGCWLRQLAVQVEIEGQETVFFGLHFNEQTNQDEVVKYTVAANGVLIYAKT